MIARRLRSSLRNGRSSRRRRSSATAAGPPPRHKLWYSPRSPPHRHSFYPYDWATLPPAPRRPAEPATPNHALLPQSEFDSHRAARALTAVNAAGKPCAVLQPISDRNHVSLALEARTYAIIVLVGCASPRPISSPPASSPHCRTGCPATSDIGAGPQGGSHLVLEIDSAALSATRSTRCRSRAQPRCAKHGLPPR